MKGISTIKNAFLSDFKQNKDNIYCVYFVVACKLKTTPLKHKFVSLQERIKEDK